MKYVITISDGTRKDRFSFDAPNAKAARETAMAAHVGTGWRVVNVFPAKGKQLSLKFKP